MLSQLGLGIVSLSVLSCLATPTPGSPNVKELEPRQSASMYTYVNLANNTGASVHRASGVLYGVPHTQGQIPATFYTDMGFNYLSAGGAQYTGAPGWIYGGYTGRFQNVLSNYRTARTYNAQFILKMSDLWGADGTQGADALWPYAGGSWAEYDRFLTQFVTDLEAYGMTTNLKILIWNEPDLTIFWNSTREVYLEMWTRTARFLRTNLAGVPLAGPSFAFRPTTTNAWWTTWLAKIKADNTAPDVYTWHLEGNIGDIDNDLQYTQPSMTGLLNSYGLPIREYVIDEYGIPAEQNPSGAAWWISRFERYNIYGLRGNWAGGAALQDYFASLLAKSGNTYSANGEFQVYKYYASSMKGYRVATVGSTDRKMDSYTVVDSTSRLVRTLVGGRAVIGTYMLQFNNISSLGLPTSGTITVRTRQFSYAGINATVGAPTNLGTVSHTYSGNVLAFPIFQTTNTTTWAFEFNY